MIYVSSIRQIGKRYKLACIDYERYGLADYDRRSSERGTLHSTKLKASLSRSRRIILEYGFCNDWDWFVTMTLNPDKYDRENLQKFRKDLSAFIRNYNARKMPADLRVRYLLVPELHLDGKSWHMHGLLHGLPPDHLSDFVPGIHPAKLCTSGFQNWSAYEKKFGYISLGRIRDKDSCVLYMTKYITKDLIKSSVDLNDRVIFASHGMKKAEYLFKNKLIEYEDSFGFDYMNEFCRVKNISFLNDLHNITDDIFPWSKLDEGEVLTWRDIDETTVDNDDFFKTSEKVEEIIFDSYITGIQIEMRF